MFLDLLQNHHGKVSVLLLLTIHHPPRWGRDSGVWGAFQIPILEDWLPLMMLSSIVYVTVQLLEIDIRTESGYC